jgi:hypothetical protein
LTWFSAIPLSPAESPKLVDYFPKIVHASGCILPVVTIRGGADRLLLTVAPLFLATRKEEVCDYPLLN